MGYAVESWLFRIRLDFELAGPPKVFHLTLGVPEQNIASLRLEVPWGNEDCVAHLNPDTSFHLPPYPANTFHPVCAFDKDSVISKEVLDRAVHLAGAWRQHLAQV